MTVSNQDPSATGDANASGEGNEESQQVSREAHRRLLDEKKKETEARRRLEAELAERNKADADRKEQELKDQQKWEEAHKLKEQELADERRRRLVLEERITTGQKYGAFVRAVGGQLDPKWQHSVDLEKIKMGEDGQIDDASLKAYAETFKKTYPEIFTKSTGPGLPNDVPRSNGPRLTPAEWRKLPGKEQDKRYDEVDWTYGKK